MLESLLDEDLDLVCCSSVAVYCSCLSWEEEKATDGNFVSFITKPYETWMKDGL